jgi:tetratricopeptide (TPR) repeat protein
MSYSPRSLALKLFIRGIQKLLVPFIGLFLFAGIQAQNKELSTLYKSLGETKTDTARVNILIHLANYYFKKNIDSALVYAKKAYKLSKNTNNYNFPDAARALADAYNFGGHLEKSLEFEIEGYNYAKKIKDTKSYAVLLTGIGSDYLMLNDYALALKYLNEALKECKDYRDNLLTLVNLAQVYASTDRYAEAHQNYNRALRLAEKEKNKRDEAVIYNRIGNLYLMEKSYDKSLSYYEKSIKMLDSTDLYYVVAGLRGIVENCIVTRKYEKGLKVAQIADSLGRKGRFIYELKIINSFISELYDSLRNYPKSLYYYKIYADLNDTIFNQENTEKMSFLQTDFETKQKAMQVTILQDEARLNKRLTIIYLLTFALIIISLFYFIKNIRQKNKILTIEKEKDALAKQKLELELHEKHREILTHSLQINQQKEVFSNINSKLVNILKLEDPLKIKQSVNLLNAEVKASVDLSDDWAQIKLHFEKVHPQFFITLKNEYPGLSNNELKLCAYVKLKFSNKEISRLLNVNSASVHVARFRLKKKMSLPEEISFDEFILTKV